ncbi:hypothetical protein CASFOL_019057 [Castilleja foliolosa]|uniref:Protein kinase domain-containing protein n=1 Tax=Castilleja foliolosa TaxID=1961234 RepID=A0ABD3D3B9_9LAMI
MAWTRGPTIGRGSSAAVSLATAASGDIFAVKSTDLSSSTLLQREEILITQLSSPYIVKCLGSDTTCEHNKHVYNLFLEYIPGGTLSDKIKKHGGSLEENAIRLHARQILMGLSYLHQKGLAHCDIKGQNILIGDGGLKIADFGCAKWVESGEPAAFAGTPAYMAPEVARGEEQSFPADVWAFGCTVIEMATGSGPWPEMKDPAAALFRIGFSGDVPEFPGWFSDAAKDMLTKCLIKDPRERWTAGQLLEHPFFDPVDEEIINCDEISEFTRKSPTSVMDQGFWDDLGALSCSENPTEIASSTDSPSSRVGALIGENTRAGFEFPGWADEEDWLTVRGEIEIEIEDTVTFARDNEDEIEAQSSIYIDNFVMDRVDGDSNSTFTVTLTESRLCMNDFSSFTVVNYENHVNGIISSSISSFPISIFCLFFYYLLIFWPLVFSNSQFLIRTRE